MNNSEVDAELYAALSSGEQTSWEQIALKVGNIVLEHGSFPSDYFRSILAIVQNERFQRLEGSWKLIRVFEENWKELSEEQRVELLKILEVSYQAFHDWMSCFVISGILGELYSDDRAFAVLCRLEKADSEMPRSFVPHGFEHIARNSSNEDLTRRALAELAKMQHDKSSMVRNEVVESLLRLKKNDSQSQSIVKGGSGDRRD
jgi:hypothetical protein